MIKLFKFFWYTVWFIQITLCILYMRKLQKIMLENSYTETCKKFTLG